MLLLVLVVGVLFDNCVDGFHSSDTTAIHYLLVRPRPRSYSKHKLAAVRHTALWSKQRNNDIDKNDDVAGTKSDMNPFTKSVWYGVEKFGQVVATFTNQNETTINEKNKPQELSMDKVNFLSIPPASLNETLQRIRLDNDRSYFLSGKVDTYIYDKDCVFADPFVSFQGRDRFVDNLQNLGSFITNYTAKIIQYNVEGGDSNPVTIVKTKIMVKLELNLPWKPVLAWPWGVTYQVDPDSYLITKHEESWDIEPWEGIKQIFRRATVKV
jgi:hypothetical protein